MHDIKLQVLQCMKHLADHIAGAAGACLVYFGPDEP
jgi:hypothetical protein